ncbi:MAG: carbohydrate ABC transporter permease [Phycisphaerales bacterium]|jgi:multiple sugar transport system permease protein
MSSRLKDLAVGLAWVSPWLVGCVVFMLGPIAMSVYYSFTDYALVDAPVWVGLDNYRELAGDRLFILAMRNTFAYAAMAVILGTVASVAIAVLLEQRLRGTALVRSLVFVPTLVPVVANCVVWLWLLNPEYGFVNRLFDAVGLSGPNWLGERVTALPTMAVMGLWVIGSPLLVCSAALKEVPASLYEAAELDGMGALRRFMHVTLPMISPAIFFNGLMSVIWSLQVLAPPMIMTRGGPDNATLTYSMYVYKTAFEFGRMGYASALAWVQILVTILLAAVVVVASRRFIHYRGA